jgi:hypothetical protein
MNKFFFYLLIIGLITLPVYGQKGDYNWCFDTVGISFNNPNLEPIPLFGTKVLWPWGGLIPSTISDCNGNLLFYCSPGEIIPQAHPNFDSLLFKIFDSKHNPLPILDSIVLLEGISFLLPYPGSNSLFLCVAGGLEFYNGHNNSVIYLIDRTKRSGLGDIVGKHILNNRWLFDVFRHSNGKDWWILTIDFDYFNQHSYDPLKRYVSYIFTEKGITDSTELFMEYLYDAPYCWFAEYYPTSYTYYSRSLGSNIKILIKAIGYLGPNITPSPPINQYDLYHIYLSVYQINPELGEAKSLGYFKICDSCTHCGSPVYLPESKKIYIALGELYPIPGKDSIFQEKYKLFQFTFNPDTTLFLQSKQQVGPTKEITFVRGTYDLFPEGLIPRYFQELKMGPNGKLYALHYGMNYISEIANPDSNADAIIFKDTALFFGEAKIFLFPTTVSASSCLGKIEIWLPDTVAKIGSKNFCIPIYAKKSGEIINGIDFEMKIRFDANAFLPENIKSTIEGKDRIITIEGESTEIKNEPGVIGWFCGEVLLGSERRVPLIIEKLQWKDSYLDTETRDGSLTLEGVCEHQLSQVELFQPLNLSVLPNPSSSDEVELIIEGKKGANYLIEIYNSNGMLVEQQGIHMDDAVAVITKSLSSYPSGLYLFKIGKQIAKIIKI